MNSCVFGFHKYEILSEEKYTTISGTEIGKIIISRCSNCGKIRVDKINCTTIY